MDLTSYFATCAAVAGSLIGLLFLAITLRLDVILGATAPVHNHGMAKAAFIALANALGVSLLALLPQERLGVSVSLLGITSVVSTARTQLGLVGRRGLIAPIFMLSAAVYVGQAVIGSCLVVASDRRSLVEILAYVVLAALIAALLRCWLLLLPELPDR